MGIWHLGLEENMPTNDVPLLTSTPSLGEVPQVNQSKLHFDSQLLGSWRSRISLNGVARGDSPYALVPSSLAPEEQMLWEQHLRM